MSIDLILAQHGESEGRMQANSLGYRSQRDNLTQAVDNLRKLNSVCVFEEFDRSLELINRNLSWSLHPTMQRNASKHKVDLSNSQISRIEELCQPDYAIYNEATKIFSEQCENVF